MWLLTNDFHWWLIYFFIYAAYSNECWAGIDSRLRLHHTGQNSLLMFPLFMSLYITQVLAYYFLSNEFTHKLHFSY